VVIKQRIPPDIQRDMDYGQLTMLVTTPDDDAKGNIDVILSSKDSASSLHIAWRRRRFKLTTWGEISIRAWRASGTETEMAKILTNKSKAQLFVFQFLDCYVVCKADDILACLQDQRKHYIKQNNDKKTAACYINVNLIPHLKIVKPIGEQ
jgi:hypothetical protein